MSEGGWEQAGMLVMRKLDELQEGQEKMSDELVLVRIEIAKLKIKSGLWGGLVGTIPAIVTVIILLLSGGRGA